MARVSDRERMSSDAARPSSDLSRQTDHRSVAADQAGNARRPHRGASKIQYVTDTAPDAPLTPAEREAILRLVGKIIGDVHLAEMRKAAASSDHHGPTIAEPIHETPEED